MANGKKKNIKTGESVYFVLIWPQHWDEIEDATILKEGDPHISIPHWAVLRSCIMTKDHIFWGIALYNILSVNPPADTLTHHELMCSWINTKIVFIVSECGWISESLPAGTIHQTFLTLMYLASILLALTPSSHCFWQALKTANSSLFYSIEPFILQFPKRHFEEEIFNL